MTDARKKQLLSQIVADLKKFNPEKIILFGSQAEGTAGEDSDFDLFVVSNSQKSMHDRAVEMRLALKNYEVPIDIVALTPKEVEEKKMVRDFFVDDIISNGKILYVS